MSSKFSITNIWNNVRELDLARIRDSAVDPVRIAIVGAEGTGRNLLAAQFRSDPQRPEAGTHTPILIYGLEQGEQALVSDLIILLLDPAAPIGETESELVRGWTAAGRRLVVLYNKIETGPGSEANLPWLETGSAEVLFGPVSDWDWLQSFLVPAVMERFPERLIALGRHFPLFREQVARNLINTTCTANAAYTFSTGLAEIVPILDIPLNVADLIILTKAQALLVYKLGLALGLSTDWQYYVTEFSGVVGSGFLWRQVARSLVGLVPVWGIIPKVAVAYSGTYTVGHAVLYWYLAGKHATRKMLKDFSRQATEKGKSLARQLLQRRKAGRDTLPETVPDEARLVCANCGTENDTDAVFCKNCGEEIK